MRLSRVSGLASMASRGVVARFAPSETTPSAREAVRFHTVTSWPVREEGTDHRPAHRAEADHRDSGGKLSGGVRVLLVCVHGSMLWGRD